MSKEFCRGQLMVIDSLMSDIDAMIRDATDLRDEEDEMARLALSPSLDGGGRGDLAS